MKSGHITSLSLIKISGTDAVTFLQGQLTNDVKLLDDNWQFSGYCNPKGRLLALLQLWREQESASNTFYALLSTDLCESIVKRLRMYVMRSKVTIEQPQTSIYGFATYNDLITVRPDLSSQFQQSAPNSAVSMAPGETLLYINNRLLLISQQPDLINNEFDANWHAFNIIDGLPQISAPSSEQFIPQMVNLDLLGGINFKKGCYTGQEIVARMHYLGNLKQRMFVCEVEDETTEIVVGEKIINNLNDPKTMGTVVNSTPADNKILAVLKLNDLDQTLYLGKGQKVSIAKSQPYAINNTSN